MSLKVFIRSSCKKAVRSNKVAVKDGLYSLPDVTENVKEVFFSVYRSEI